MDKREYAVHKMNGNTLVHAGAGSGKTRIFVLRIANLIQQGVDPKSILGLTFTKEASDNMRIRLVELVGKKAYDVQLSTFHSFAYGENNKRNLYKGKSLMKNWWKIQTAWSIVGKDGLDINMSGGDFAEFISLQKSYMIQEGNPVVCTEYYTNESVSVEHLQKAYDLYCQMAREMHLYDFDDMLMDFYYELITDNEYLKEIQDTYQYIMVDEFQDTNHANLEILKLITHNNLFVVGDFRQGIYSFINADVENILKFKDIFPDVEVIELTENFRSQKSIVDYGNAIIQSAHNKEYNNFLPQEAIHPWKSYVDLHLTDIQSYEKEDVVHRILKEIQQGKSPNDIAVLMRTNSLIGEYESQFAEYDIPVVVSNNNSFFDRSEIVDLLSYLYHVYYPENNTTLVRIMNRPNRYISNQTINEISKLAYDNEITFEEAMHGWNGQGKNGIRRVLDTFNSLRNKGKQPISVEKMLRFIYSRTQYREYLYEKSPQSLVAKEREDNCESLFYIAKNFYDVDEFFNHIRKVKMNSKSNKEGVHLLTIHASKGLEFDTVYLPELTEKNFPHEMAKDVEEERRLFYVGATRAINELHLSAHVFDKSGGTYKLSPFLLDTWSNIKSLRKEIVRGEKSKGEIVWIKD